LSNKLFILPHYFLFMASAPNGKKLPGEEAPTIGVVKKRR